MRVKKDEAVQKLLRPADGKILRPAIGGAEALRAIANKFERGEISSFSVVIIDRKEGRPRDNTFVSADTPERDMNEMGNVMLNICENFAKALGKDASGLH